MYIYIYICVYIYIYSRLCIYIYIIRTHIIHTSKQNELTMQIYVYHLDIVYPKANMGMLRFKSLGNSWYK